MTLPARLFLLVLIAVLPAVGIQAYGVFQIRAERERALEAQATRLLGFVEAEEAHLVEEARLTLAGLAEAAPLRDGDGAACQAYLERLARRSPSHRTVLAAGRDGQVLCSADPDLAGGSVAGYGYVRRALDEGDFVVGEWTPPGRSAAEDKDGPAFLPFATPFAGADGETAGVVAMALPLPSLSGRFSAGELPPGASLTVADRKGTVLAAFPQGRFNRGDRLPESLLQLLASRVGGIVHLKDRQGREHVVAWSPPTEGVRDLFVSVSIDRALAMQGIERAARIELALAVAGFLVAVLAAWFGGTLFLRRPVEALARAAQDWTAGRSAARADLRAASPELVQLGRAFDAMAEALEARERSLSVTTERFQTALRNSRVVVFNQDRELRYSWIHGPVLGYTVAEVIGRTDRELFERAEDAERVEDIKRGVLETGQGAREEIALHHGSETLFFDLTVDPLRDPRGTIVGVTCAAVDVTDRKRAEAELQGAREEAERAASAKSKFLAVASHDLRQPVQSLYLFAAALAERIQGHPAQPMLDRMRQSLDALKGLLDGLLDMSRLESGKMEVNLADIRVNQVLGRLVAEYEPRARQKGLSLRAIPTRAWVRSDPVLLERILRNFIENALRYTREGRILIGCRHRAGTVRVEVCDSGVGIPPDRMDEIFEEFTQIGERGGERGLGLGLAIVKRLSQLLGHRIAVRSRVGSGSAFTLELPRVGSARHAAPRPAGGASVTALAEAVKAAGGPRGIAPAATGVAAALGAVRAVPKPAPARVALPAPTAEPAASGSKGLVLVIDDEAIILLGLKTMLEGWGFDVLTARSGEQALERLRADGRRPQLLLADYQLQQGRTGPEALNGVQQLIGNNVPGIILTGDTAPERLREAEDNGYRLLLKPVSPNDLRKAMRVAGAA
ncbi:ATP-binding protein [Azospirillum sp. SYSU D00513]|uniref:hybrid sensor histidine kinase/response regulator n=1 Tax=Azospirillum sp. SYSU D00513 TaxID=2812561 RepID=UPI001A95DC7D|nr:ATP-binding protein [Azospirillum sp. SYSU D00513]